jgi:uncharacterized SAM-binding protein YcdF (DUF218 family)
MCHCLGVDPDRVSLLTDALDTVDEARSAAARHGDAPLVLVTSAAHMPRAMRLFAGVGLHPVACPTDFLTPRPGAPRRFTPFTLFPNAENVSHGEQVFYEYLGIAWAALRGQTSAVVGTGHPAPAPH